MNKSKNSYINIKTVVDKVVYYNKSSRWGVLSVRNTLDEDPIFLDKKITLAGNFDEVYTGCEIIFSGSVVSNPKYGFQIQISSLQINKDVSGKESIINFLVKSSIKGISIANANKIYDAFGDDSIKVVLHETSKIKTIKGIGEDTYKQVKSSIQEYLRMEELINFCTKLGIPFSVIYKLDREFGEKALTYLKNDIYSIIEVTDEFSFNVIDEIALKAGTKKEDSNRLRAALIYCVKTHVMMNSSTGISVGDLKQLFMKVTGVIDQTYYNTTISKLVKEDLVIIDGSFVYWKYYYDKEEFVATMLSYLKNTPIKTNIDENIIEKAINSFKFKLNEQQINAIRGVINSRVAVLTGGPGTGKSTITKAVVDIFKNSNIHFELLSPTGKATRRITECTGYSAYTVHKYLHAKSASLDDIELPVVPQDTAIIIDESSMLDILMLAKIVEIAKYTPIRVILVGDQDQLPSVQVGNVLADVINSGVADVYKLTDIMRQAKDSHIIKYCADINHGKLIPQCEEDDFEYCEFYDENDLFDELQSKYFGEVEKHGLDQVQIIAPYKKGNLGTLNLNKFIGNFNDNLRMQTGYAKGDKVMQIRNDYGSGIFNGECGVVDMASDDEVYVKFTSLNPEQVEDTILDFEDVFDELSGELKTKSSVGLIRYDEKNLVDLMLAYASTCHKSQGAEYSTVFVVLDDSTGNFLLTRKLLYTAVSRGKKKVYIYSSPGCLTKCIRNTSEVSRITKLCHLLQTSNTSSNLTEFDDFEIDEVPF